MSPRRYSLTLSVPTKELYPSVNILFVNYGDFTTNSLNHIGGFANELCTLGNACIVAVPKGKSTLRVIPGPLFIPATYDEILAKSVVFPDGRAADVIHAWTPREVVRRFVLDYQRQVHARLIIHLEDNEDFLLSTWFGRPISLLGELSEAEFAENAPQALSHPRRYRQFLSAADGVTVIVESLRQFVPKEVPSAVLPPGVDPNLYHPRIPDQNLRKELGLRDDERVIVFTGSNTFANEPEMRELYVAVSLLNSRGIPTRLVRAGYNSPTFQAALPEALKTHVLDLGFQEKSKLPDLIALADVLVQPGRAGPFNDFRLPSKLPEFFASGKPVILPASNIGMVVRDGVDAILLRTGEPEEIADACERVFKDPELAEALGKQAVAFAGDRFNLTSTVKHLSQFYRKISKQTPHAGSTATISGEESEVTLALRALASHSDEPKAAAIAADLAPLVAELERQTSRRGLSSVPENSKARNDYELTRQHADNLEKLLAASQLHAGELEKAYALTRQHIENVEQMVNDLKAQLAASKKHAGGLETERSLAQRHIQNLENESREARKGHADAIQNLENELQASRKGYADAMGAVAEHRQLRNQAEILLKAARQQTTAMERALFAAEADAIRLKESLLSTQEHAARLDAGRVLAQEHAANLERAIEKERVLTGQHIEDVERAIGEERTLTRQHIANLEHNLAEVRKIYEQTLAGHLDKIRERESKIAQMQRSFSWRSTAPLRALRRTFSGRGRPPVLSQKITFNIDYPRDWTVIPPVLNLRGWAVHNERLQLKAVRARMGQQVINGDVGIERLDVLDHFRDHPSAGNSGWAVKFDTPRFFACPFSLEAQDEVGIWHPFFYREIRRTAKAVQPPSNTYAAWIESYDTLTPEEIQRIRERLKALKRRPLISVLMPVYNTPKRWLVAAIESVRAQIYDNWELCIADDASKDPHVQKILRHYARKDKRIKVVFREANGHISAASNSALGIAHGEFVALFDHDDELRAHALAAVALELDRHPEADLIYSDEDKIDENGHRYDHYFKPDWNPDLFLVQNFISHLGVYRTALIREVGGFRTGYEGSQDWDLAMRIVERSGPDRIRHIPKILYHWRAVRGSTAMVMSSKNYAVTAAQKAITEHFERLGIGARVTATKGHYWRVHYPIPNPAPRVTLIIPTRNRAGLLRACVTSVLEKTTYPNFEILIVDNGSDESETLSYLKEIRRDPRCRILDYAGEFNFSAINNFGVAHTDAPVIGLLNNDLEVIHGDWLDEMVSHALRPEIGCVGAKLYYPNDRIQHGGVILGIGGVAAHAWQTHPRGISGQAHRAILQQNLSAVTAACLVIRREVYLEVGGLEEDNLAVAFNDVDFCLKVRAAGYRNFWTPFAELYHHESASRGTENTLAKRDRFRTEVDYMTKKWGEVLLNDPAYNPNLTLQLNDFTLASPPRPWTPLAP